MRQASSPLLGRGATVRDELLEAARRQDAVLLRLTLLGLPKQVGLGVVCASKRHQQAEVDKKTVLGRQEDTTSLL